MKNLLYLILFFHILCASLLASNETSKYQSNILIVTFDAGETYALLPVVKELEKKRASYLILSMGTSMSILEKSDVPKNKIIHLDDDLSYPDSIDRAWDRYTEPNLPELKKALRQVTTGVVLSGVASFVQKHIVHYFSKKGAYTFSFYDNFNPVQKSSYYPIANEIHRVVDNVLVPSLVVQGSVYRSNVNVVGHPTIEEWSKYPYLFSKPRTRSEWDIPSDKKIITFICEYSESYKASLKSFLEKVRDREDYYILLPLHPKSDGYWEKALVKELSITNAIILDKTQSTPEAVIASDLVVCHQSTVGIQALFAERPVLFYDPYSEGLAYNVAVDNWGLADICLESSELIGAIERGLDSKLEKSALYKETGIPRDSTQMITQLLMQNRSHHR